MNDPLNLGADREKLRRVCQEYLAEYHSAKVPAPQLDAPTVRRAGVSVGSPPREAENTCKAFYMDHYVEAEQGNINISDAEDFQDMILAAIEQNHWRVVGGLRPFYTQTQIDKWADAPPMQWTTTPPNAIGWWWHYKPGDDSPYLSMIARLDSDWIKTSGYWWLGPIPVPAPPEVTK